MHVCVCVYVWHSAGNETSFMRHLIGGGAACLEWIT